MKRIIAGLLCLFLFIPLLLRATPAHAADSYLITIADNTVLTDVGYNSMAVYMDGIIYVPYDVFENVANITINYNKEKQFVSVFRSGAMVHFELDTGIMTDYLNKRTVTIAAKVRDGVPYLPLAILATWMNMYFSITLPTSSGITYPIIRICSDPPTVPDETIIKNQTVKLKAISKARDIASGLVAPEPVVPARNLALMFVGAPQPQIDDADILPSILDALETFHLPASFFVAQEDLVPNAEYLREIFARGFKPGILLTDNEDPVQQAVKCSEIYAQVLHARVRLVCAPDIQLTDQQKEELAVAGFLLWEYAHYSDASITETNKVMNALKKSLSSAKAASVLRLDPSGTSLEVIPLLYSYLNAQNFTVVPMNDWTLPF